MRVVRLASVLFTLDPALVFVLFLASPTPFRCHINAIFLFLVALLFGLMYSCRSVLRRAIYCIENQWRCSCVKMSCPSWHNNHVSSLDVLTFSGNLSKPCSGREGKNLVHGVNLEIFNSDF